MNLLVSEFNMREKKKEKENKKMAQKMKRGRKR